MMACSCEKGGNNVSNGCGKNIGAWKDNDNDHDVAKCKVGISDHSKGEQH